MCNRPALTAMLVVSAWTGVAFGDAPLPPPSTVRACSPSGEYCAVSDPDTRSTTVSKLSSNRQWQPQWSVPEWHRHIAVSDAGELVAGYDGGNLIPIGYDPQMVMLSFYRSGRLVEQLSLESLFLQLSALERTSSHYNWGSYRGWNDDGLFEVATSEGRVLSFDPATGRRVSATSIEDASILPTLLLVLAGACTLLLTWLLWRRR